MAAAAIVASAVAGVLAAAVFGSVASGLQLIGHRSEPEVLATTDLYFRLNDMDAQVANVLLVGMQRGLGIGRAQAQAIYWTGPVPAAAIALISVLVLAGVRPRLAEYRMTG